MSTDKGSRGVEHPIASDMALVGDTKQELHTKPLPRRKGPNFGYDATGGEQDSTFRVTGDNTPKK